MDTGRVVVLDISSDEEQDSDEVVVVQPRSKFWRQRMKDVDHDCVVLDGDPDNKPVDYSAIGSGSLLIVGEKGKIACRDYPHSRHLCPTFPFSTTQHERRCNQCHCYVCDSIAPCVNWGTGISSKDHCHATDKEETWKIQRRNFKLGKIATTLSASKISDTCSSTAAPHQVNKVAPVVNIACMSPCPTPQNQVSSPAANAAIRVSTSSNLSANIQKQITREFEAAGFVRTKNGFTLGYDFSADIQKEIRMGLEAAGFVMTKNGFELRSNLSANIRSQHKSQENKKVRSQQLPAFVMNNDTFNQEPNLSAANIKSSTQVRSSQQLPGFVKNENKFQPPR